MKPESTPRTPKSNITGEICNAYEERDRTLGGDPGAPTMSPEYWASGTVGKYYRARRKFRNPEVKRMGVERRRT